MRSEPFFNARVRLPAQTRIWPEPPPPGQRIVILVHELEVKARHQPQTGFYICATDDGFTFRVRERDVELL